VAEIRENFRGIFWGHPLFIQEGLENVVPGKFGGRGNEFGNFSNRVILEEREKEDEKDRG